MKIHHLKNKLILISFFFSILNFIHADSSILDQYIAKADPHFSWKKISTTQHPNKVKVHHLHMNSQVWLTGKDVQRILWNHTVNIHEPEVIEHSTALLLISAGKNNPSGVQHPQKIRSQLSQIAAKSKGVVVEITCVPNQPLTFLSDPKLKQRIEDDILAYSWARFLKVNDPHWLTHLPMTKSAVRAMDTVTEYYAQQKRSIKINRFVVTGASKRGWTTWLTAAADKRVVGIAPMVIDLLNMEKSFLHHRKAYGKYAEAVHDYVDNGITDLLGTEKGKRALPILDPYSYLDRYTMPKLIINASSDQFFLPDSWKFYYHDLPGEKHLRYIPNAGHQMNASIYTSIGSFYQSIIRESKIPAYQWNIKQADTFTLVSKTKPKFVKFWTVQNPKTRDFRLSTIKKTWKSKIIQASKQGDVWHYKAKLSQPKQGWSAGYLEFSLPDSKNPEESYLLSTGISVIPEKLPHK